MSSRAASQKKGDNHLYFDVQERRVADSGTAMENSSYGVDVRDQSIQQGNGQIRRSKSRPTTSSSRPTNMKHNAYAYAYVSPFIQSAELRAQERARMGAAKRRKQQAEWNSEVAPRGNLFDPTIHKEDIFKLQPRRPKSASDQAGQEADGPVQHNQTNTRHRDDDMVRVGKIDSTMRPKMTMRSSGEAFGALRRRSVLASTSIDKSRTSGNYISSNNNHMSNTQQHTHHVQTTSGTSPMHSFAGDSVRQMAHPGGVRSSQSGALTNHAGQPVSGVTRSTSPINAVVVDSILQEDGIVNDDDYTIHFKTFQKQAGVANHHLGLEQAYVPGAGPVRNEAYYTEVLRHRLRDILLDHNDTAEDRRPPNVEYEVTDCEDLNTSEEHIRVHGHSRTNKGRGRDSNRNNYADRKYLRSKSPLQHLLGRGGGSNTSRGRSGERCGEGCSCYSGGGGGATEELMNSMAQIMSAVGSIVTKQHKNPFKAMMRRQQRRLAKEEQGQAQGQGGYLNHDRHYPQAAADHYYRDGSRAGSSSRARAPAATAPYTIGLDGSVSQVPYTYPSSSHPTRTTGPSTTHPLDTVKHAVPRSKSHMLDVIMAKLQAIERSEQQIQEYLQTTSVHPAGHVDVEGLDSNDDGAGVSSEAVEEIDRHLHSAYPLDASLLAVGAGATSSIGVGGVKMDILGRAVDNNNPRETYLDQNSLLAQADSDSDTDLPAAHTASNTTSTTATHKKKVKMVSHGTQDDPHTLATLHQHLLQSEEVAARGPSLAALKQQELHQHAVSDKLTATQLRDKEQAYLKTLPRLARNEDRNQDLFAYMRELDHCRELKDVAFRSRGITMAQVADRMTEEICEQLLGSVAGELDHYIHDYSEKFLDKI